MSDYKLTEQGQNTEAVRTALDDAGVKWLETEGADGIRGVLAEIPSDNFILRWFGAGRLGAHCKVSLSLRFTR